MLACQQCGCHISRLDAEGGAQIAGDAQRTLCPSCAVAVYFAEQDEDRQRSEQDRAGIDEHRKNRGPFLRRGKSPV